MTLPRQGVFALHVACGTVRGDHPLFHQDCPCRPAPRRPGIFGRVVDLCAVCGHGLAHSGSPFTSLACVSCRRVEQSLRGLLGQPVLPLARREAANAFREVDGSVVPFRPLSTDLWAVAADLPQHGRGVVRRLARGLDEPVLPLALWELLHPESAERSLEAYAELLRRTLPHAVVQEVRQWEAERGGTGQTEDEQGPDGQGRERQRR